MKVLRYSHDLLKDAAFQLFCASGSPDDEAGLISRQLVQANLAGHDSHGIQLVRYYMGQLNDGIIVPGMQPEIIQDGGATAVVSGNRGYGQVTANRGMDLAVEKSRNHGVAGVGLTNLTHIGRLADYATQGARAGMVTLVFTAAGGSAQTVAPFGGAQRRLATNPLAAGFPTDRQFPVVMDMATSAVAFGKLWVAQDAGNRMADGLLIDSAGNPTNDPKDAIDGGAILPLGGAFGHKGYLLSVLVEVMAGLLTGGGFVGKEDNPTFNNCTFMIAIDVEAFLPIQTFKDHLNCLIEYLKATPSQPGEAVLYPGEVEERTELDRRERGVPVPAETIRGLKGELDKFGIDLQFEPLP